MNFNSLMWAITVLHVQCTVLYIPYIFHTNHDFAINFVYKFNKIVLDRKLPWIGTGSCIFTLLISVLFEITLSFFKIKKWSQIVIYQQAKEIKELSKMRYVTNHNSIISTYLIDYI